MSDLPMWLQAGFWGGLAGAALLLGSFAGYFFKMSQRTVAGVMAFGSGALISAMSFDLIEEAYAKGGLLFAALGLILGALIYSTANLVLAKYGARHRKRSNLTDSLKSEQSYDNAMAIALGALVDGIPESLVIGISLLQGGAVSLVTVASVFISNIPEALSSTVGMKNNGRKAGYVFSVWGGIAVTSAIVAALGNLLLRDLPGAHISIIMAVAGGAILSMIVDTMIPEAFEVTHNYAGFITVVGFLCAYLLEKL